MAGKLHHEELYRGLGAVAQLADLSVVVCGVGALGSNLVDTLVRQGFQLLRIIDDDRVEEHNTSTQIFGLEDVGAFKADVLANRAFRQMGIEIETVRKRLDDRNSKKLLKDADLIIDTFDNSESRTAVQRRCRESKMACLHVGLFEGYGEVVWDSQYRVPNDVAGDVCDYPLARNLVTLVVSVAAEAVVRFALDGETESHSITLGDFAVLPLAAAAEITRE